MEYHEFCDAVRLEFDNVNAHIKGVIFKVFSLADGGLINDYQ